MEWKSIGLVTIGIACGYSTALLLHSDEKLGTPPRVQGAEAPESGTSNAQSDADGLRRRLAALTSEMESLRGRSGPAALPELKTFDERMKSLDERAARYYTDALQQETAQLLAAGFPKERIEWLRHRTDELDASRRRADTERRKKGIPVTSIHEGLAYVYDNDLDLVKEIGAQEYERYREALGRPNSVAIASVLPGGIADTYGLKSGDQIVRYDGSRVYNIAQVNVLAQEEGNPGEVVHLEVMREGQPVRLAVLRGDLSVGTPVPVAQRSRSLRLLVREQTTQP